MSSIVSILLSSFMGKSVEIHYSKAMKLNNIQVCMLPTRQIQNKNLKKKLLKCSLSKIKIACSKRDCKRYKVRKTNSL